MLMNKLNRKERIKINTIKLINGDCLDKLKNIKDKSVNLVLIDPPYNISKADWDKWKTIDEYVYFMGQVFIECQRVLKDNGSFYFFHNDFLQMAELQHWIKKNTKFVFKSLITIDKLDNNYIKDLYGSQEHFRNYLNLTEYVCFYTLQDENVYSQGFKKNYIREICNFTELRQYAKQILDDNNLTLRQVNKILGHRKLEHFFYWNSTEWELPSKKAYEELKTIAIVNKTYEELRNSYEKEYEVLRTKYEKMRYIFNATDGLKNCWSYSFREDKKLKHPTQKPVQLIKDIITYSSNEGDLVLDFFMGSGTCAEACLQTNRSFIGIELDNTYFETCKNRVETYIKDNNLQDIHIEIA